MFSMGPIFIYSSSEDEVIVEPEVVETSIDR